MEAIKHLRAECVRHYVERCHSPAHADLIVPKDEAEVRRIYGRIQEEMEKAISLSIPLTTDVTSGKNWLEQE